MAKAKIIIREHCGFKEFKKAQKHFKEGKLKFELKQYFGQFQYLFCKGKKVISIVELWDLFNECWYWEILRIDLKKNGDVERFPTFESAQKRAWEILG